MIFGGGLYWHFRNEGFREAAHVPTLGVPDRMEVGQGEVLLRFPRYQASCTIVTLSGVGLPYEAKWNRSQIVRLQRQITN